MQNFTLPQLFMVMNSITEEKINYTKLQAGLVWLAASGKMDRVKSKIDDEDTTIKKLSELGILEEK